MPDWSKQIASFLPRSLLYGLKPSDPLTLLIAAGGLATVATLASLIPAQRRPLSPHGRAARRIRRVPHCVILRSAANEGPCICLLMSRRLRDS